MGDWCCYIKKTTNGYCVETENIEGHREFVIEIKDDENETRAEQIAFRELCWRLMDYFAVYNDKHKNQYIEIKVTNTKDD